MRVVNRFRRLDDRALGPTPPPEAFPQVLPRGKVSPTVRRGVTILTWLLAASLVPIALDAGRALLAPLWMLAAVILVAAAATFTSRHGTRFGPIFGLIGAGACGLFALWLVGVVHLEAEQYGPTLGLAVIGARMSWIVYRATLPAV